jgi:2-methylcitrate dehydratase PrpD
MDPEKTDDRPNLFRPELERGITRRGFLETAAGLTGGMMATSHFTQSEASAAPLAGLSAPSLQTASLVAKLARFVFETRYDALPPVAIDKAKMAIMDCIGVAVAGGTEESAQISGRLVREERAKEESTVYGQRMKSSATQAAFLNGIAAHAHDFDHSFVIGGQPTSPIIPAVFSLSDALGSSGKQVLEAYVAGFETTATLMFALQNAGGAGWHANGVVGVFGAAAACARLLGLSQSETETALAIAASMASGVTSNFGTMTKPLHVGQAARNGVLAPRLAKAGFTANTQTLEARNGFFDCYYPGGKLDVGSFDGLGVVYAIEKYGVRFKPYPCGGLTHTAIYGTIKLRTEHQLTSGMIQRIEVQVPADTAAPLVYRVPRTALEGKFSMPYLVARALIDGNVTLETFTDEAVRNKAVLDLLERIEMKADSTLQSGSDGSRPSTVVITLANGQTLKLHERFPKGSPQVPMTADELLAKFRACTRTTLNAATAERALGYVQTLESMPSVRRLTALLGGDTNFKRS